MAVFEGVQIHYRVRQSSEAKNSLLSWLDECLASQKPSSCCQHPRYPQGHPLGGCARALTVAPCRGRSWGHLSEEREEKRHRITTWGLDRCEPQSSCRASCSLYRQPRLEAYTESNRTLGCRAEGDQRSGGRRCLSMTDVTSAGPVSGLETAGRWGQQSNT